MTDETQVQSASEDGQPERRTVVCRGCGSILPGMESSEDVLPYTGTCPKCCGREFDPYAPDPA